MGSGRFRPRAAPLLVYLMFCLPPAQPPGAFPSGDALPSTPEAWTADGAAQAALGFKIERPRGVVLSFEARDGAHERLQARATKTFAFREEPNSGGRLLGQYRTDGLTHYGAVVTARFLTGTAELGHRDFYLLPSADWRTFDLAVRFIPPGTDAVELAIGLEAGAAGTLLADRLEFGRPSRRLMGCGAYQPFARAAAPDGLPNAVSMTRIAPSPWGWWLVTPKGRGFFSLGLTSASPLAADRLVALGFNSKADAPNSTSWTSLAEFDPTRTVRAFLELDSSSIVPDPYDKAASTQYRSYLFTAVGPAVGAPSIVATITDKSYDFATIGSRLWNDTSRTEMIRLLRERYRSIDLLNREWKTAYATFEGVADAKPDLAHANGPMAEGLRALARAYFSRYLLVTTQLLRAIDPTHLVFSPPIKLGPGLQETLPFLDLFAAYDAVSVTLHPSNEHAGLDDNELQALNLVAAKTGRPILITGFETPTNSGTAAPLLEQTAQLLIGLYNQPFVLGVHWSDVAPSIESVVLAFNQRVWSPDSSLAAPIAKAATQPSAPSRVRPIVGVPTARIRVGARPVSAVQKETHAQ